MENLDDIIRDMKKVDTMSWEFNPWWHRVFNHVSSLLPSWKRNVIYVVTGNEVYIGPERRSKISKAFRDLDVKIKLAMMSSTVKINFGEDE